MKAAGRKRLSPAGLVILVLGFGVVGWVGCESPPLNRTPPKPGAEKMLLGRISEGQLYAEFPQFKAGSENYLPNADVLEKLRKFNKKVDILLFFGTWSGDSISEVPKLLRVVEVLGNPGFSLQMYGLDRSRDDGTGLARRLKVERVPTVIVVEDGWELGRIVAYPKTTMEGDLLLLLTGPR